jgi:ABC-2 type transport system permease protein
MLVVAVTQALVHKMKNGRQSFLADKRKILSKYGGIFVGLCRASAISELAFRFNIFVRIFTDILWYAAQLSIFEVLFRHISQLNGWTLPTIRVFMGILFVTDSIFMFFFQVNLDQLGTKIRRGDLDLLLAKPVNSQWFLSLQKISMPYAGNFVMACMWLAWALTQIPDFQIHRLLWLGIMIPCSVIIVYSLRFMVAASSLFLTQADAINQIWWQLYRLGTRPDNTYPIALKYSVLTFLPVGFMASVPTRLLLGLADPLLALLGCTLAGLLLWASTRFWRRGLRQYSSASS